VCEFYVKPVFFFIIDDSSPHQTNIFFLEYAGIVGSKCRCLTTLVMADNSLQKKKSKWINGKSMDI